ncbi:MAG TPA: molybdopterin-dependent oxidoreductase [Candidatus Baltobacteraceae bacterium]|jgi:NADH-quinone oxidoreductase subunit G|nr:molybdopterin-dependent oxidoreductase [Candidatus Baltobacteraceae bacterium]
MPDQKTVSLTIDGVVVTVPDGTLLVEAAKRIQRDIPVYCYHEKLGPAGLCRICLVEIEKMSKLQIACNTLVTEGMVVRTLSDRALDGRRAVLEFLLANHPLDCPICDKGGECDLQDYAVAYGSGSSRLVEPKGRKPKAIDLGPTIVLDDERCIVCQRCSRFDDLITREQSLVVKERGERDVIATATDAPYVSNFSGNVTELCPVGALTSKTYRFKSRPWDLQRTATTCTQCSVGCALNVDVRHEAILRTMSDPEDPVSDGWLCDRGRYNIAYLDDERRLTSPLLRDGENWTQIGWDDAITLWAKVLRTHPPSAHGVIGGGRLLNEEAYLLSFVFRALGTRNIDWRTGRQFETTAGSFEGTLADLERAQLILVLGVPPSQTAPILDLRIRKAVGRFGARLISVGPLAAGSFVPQTRVRSVTEIPPAAFDVRRIAVVYDGISRDLLAEANAMLRPLQAHGTQIFGFVAGEQANARGAEVLGLLPRDGGLDTRGIFSAAVGGGVISTLACFGADPLLRHPDRILVERALQSFDFTVVSELFLTPTAQRAHLVLPARSAFEKTGSTTNLAGTLREVRAATAAPVGTLSDGEMLVALAAALGIEIPSDPEISRRVREMIGVPLRGGEELSFSGRAPTPREGFELVVAEHPFAGGGTSLHDARVSILRPHPQVGIAPASAQAAGVADGDIVDLTSGDRFLRDLRVRVDEDVAEGLVVVTAGLPQAPANALPATGRVLLKNIRSVREVVASGGVR